MTTTILAVVALSGSLVPGGKPEFQAQTDYGQALKRAADEKKPMVVLIGKGDTFAKLLADTGLSADAKKLLSEKFVCVTVDVTTANGSELAGQFQLTDGLIISSAGGTHQALRHAGSVSAADLAKHATTYATATGVPATTVTTGTPVVTSTSFYSGSAPAAAGSADHSAPFLTIGGCANGSCGTVAPAGGGCANGSCGVPSSAGRGRVFRR